ncbi:MAG: sodium:solute symporter [Blastocatellia bacterium]|nr:sodium:solute symporter [Blastocatellia bacterium]MCX7752471.1 sodium:solute symporter [Blastocatellia bacterium]MDW8257408.1 sodium:solute symporter [Acidobacteriota bacterium]
MRLHPLDLTILIAYLVGTTLLGLWLGRGQRTTKDYFVGGRNLPWWAIALSIVATETSTVTFISVPGYAYMKGANGEGGDLTFMQLVCGYLVGRLIVSVFFIPLYFRGELLTAYQVLAHRFGERARRAASGLFLVTRSLADGFRLFATAIVLAAVTGWDDPISIAVIGAATILYTYVGGQRAVVWTDAIQFGVYMLGALAAVDVLLGGIPGGWTTAWTVAEAHGKWRVFDFTWNLTRSYTFWSGIVGGAFLAMATHGTDQLIVQRYLTSRTARQAMAALLVSALIVFLQFLLFLLIGVLLFVFYAHFPPPTPFAKSDRIFPYFIVHELPAGFVGLIVAAIFAAAMSTLSSSLNSSAAAAVTDFYRPLRGERFPEAHYLRVARGLTLGWGIIQISVALVARALSQRVVDEVLAIAAFTNGAILGVFFLGTLTRRVGESAALGGMMSGLLVMLYVKFFTSIAWPWFVVIGSAATFITGWAIQTLRELAVRRVELMRIERS